MMTGCLIFPADRAAQERESSRQVEAQRLDYEEQIFKLKQENFVLAARVGALHLVVSFMGYHRLLSSSLSVSVSVSVSVSLSLSLSLTHSLSVFLCVYVSLPSPLFTPS